MNSFLANMRWICLPSDNLGQDWFEKSKTIDTILSGEGMDLAEEAVYLVYSDLPELISEGEGSCLIARSVVGPKKQIGGGFRLIDWVAAPVHRALLDSKTLTEMMDEVGLVRRKLLTLRPKVGQGFTICIRRRLKPELVVETEVIFSE